MNYEKAMKIVMYDAEKHFMKTKENYRAEHEFKEYGLTMYINMTYVEFIKRERENATIH